MAVLLAVDASHAIFPALFFWKQATHGMVSKAMALVCAHAAQHFSKQLGTWELQRAKGLVKAIIPKHLMVR